MSSTPLLRPTMPVLKTLVEPEVKAQFRARAQSQGLSESELLRALVLVATEQEPQANAPVVLDPADADLERITVRMPRFMLQAAKARAEKKGMAPSRWITALVQSNLTHNPVMNDEELAALLGNLRELVAIGRNINQMAKSLNQNFHATEQVRLKRLYALKVLIEENKQAIRLLVRASQHAWEAP